MPAAQVTDATLTIATTTDVVNYNPLIGNSRSDYWITNLMYPHLLSIGPDGEKAPELAAKWGYVDDTTGFYEIRDDMKWSDGKPLTAEDVAYTLNAVKKDKPAGTLLRPAGQLRVGRRGLRHPGRVQAGRAGRVGDRRRSASGATSCPQHVFEPAGSVATFANDGTNGGWVSAGPVRADRRPSGQSYTMERVDNYPLVEGGKPERGRRSSTGSTRT